MLHGFIALKFWEESYLGPVLDSCWFVLTRVELVLTCVGLVLTHLDLCWLVLTRVRLVLIRVNSCWYSCIKIDLIKSILIHEYQHKSTRINTSQHESTRINTSPTRVNTNQHEADTSQHESKLAQHEFNTSQHESVYSLKLS